MQNIGAISDAAEGCAV